MLHYAVVWFTANSKNFPFLIPIEFYVTHWEPKNPKEVEVRKKLQVAYECTIHYNRHIKEQKFKDLVAYAGIIELDQPLENYLKKGSVLSENQYISYQEAKSVFQNIHRFTGSLNSESINKSKIYQIKPIKFKLILAMQTPSSTQHSESKNSAIYVISNVEKLRESQAFNCLNVLRYPTYLMNQSNISGKPYEHFETERLKAPIYLMNEEGKIYSSEALPVNSISFFSKEKSEPQIPTPLSEKDFSDIVEQLAQKFAVTKLEEKGAEKKSESPSCSIM